MANQLTKSVHDFLHRSATLAFHRKSVGFAPAIPLAIRAGIAGHLNLPPGDELAGALGKVLTALVCYAKSLNPIFLHSLYGDVAASSPQLRLVSQLASGFDQLAADVGVPLGYRLHTVLPGERGAVARAVARNVAARGDPAPAGIEQQREAAKTRFEELLQLSERVLELDSDRGEDFSSADYVQAGTVILDHSDCLIVAIHPSADAGPGGTVWMEQRAHERNLPVVRLKLDAIEDSELFWTTDGRRQRCKLFDANVEGVPSNIFAAALDGRLIGSVKTSYPALGWFERRYAAQLDPAFNSLYWHNRWYLPDTPEQAPPVLARARAQIDTDFAAAKIWSDNRASAFAELLRGSFHVSALLGLLAIGGAATGLWIHAYSIEAKLFEMTCLLLVIWFARRSHLCHWRSQWIRMRQLERLIDQAAWLSLVGRGHNRAMEPVSSKQSRDRVERWADIYFRAVVRVSSFPTARFTPDYLISVQTLVAENLISGQIAYFDDESHQQQNAYDSLTTWMTALVILAATAVLIYFGLQAFSHFGGALLGPRWASLHSVELEDIKYRMGICAAWCGILLPAVVSTLAAIRSFGEYDQLANKYSSIRNALESIGKFLYGRLPDAHTDGEIAPLRSAVLARKTSEATAILLQETMGWGTLFGGKSIEVV